MFTIDPTQTPALIDGAFQIVDTDDVLLNGIISSFDASLSDVYIADMINADKTLNLDLEGIAFSAAGGLWLVSEGAGTGKLYFDFGLNSAESVHVPLLP
jgi:hypothetical protein